MRRGKRREWRGVVPLLALALLVAPTLAACDDTEPRDAVPLDSGGIAFIARVPGSTKREAAADLRAGAPVQVTDRYAVFVIDAARTTPRIVYDGLVAPFNIATNGKDTLYVIDLAGGADGGGALIRIPVSGGDPALLAEGYRPQGVATDVAGTVYFSGRDASSGAPGVFAIDGLAVRPVVVGGPLRSPTGLDVADDGTVFVADATGAPHLADSAATGRGRGAVFEIAKGGAATLVTAGFEASHPTGVLVSGKSKVIVSFDSDRGSQTAILVVDRTKPNEPALYSERLSDIYASAGLHRSRLTGALVWSGGDAFYVIQP